MTMRRGELLGFMSVILAQRLRRTNRRRRRSGYARANPGPPGQINPDPTRRVLTRSQTTCLLYIHMADTDLLEQLPPHPSALAARGFVHRLAPTQVLLTEVRPTGPDEFRATARWPRVPTAAGALVDARHDPLFVAETLRQLGIYLPLRFYGLTAESRLLIEELRFALEPTSERPVGTEIGCVARAVRRNAGGAGSEHMRSLHLTVRLRAQGRDFAQADVIARVLCPAAFRAVRHRGRGAATGPEEQNPAPLGAVDAARVGAVRQEDVLVAVDGQGAVRIAPADPFHSFFHDHPGDHITGMTLIGALQQTAALQANEPRLRLRSCTLRALRFTEPTPPPIVEIGTAGRFEIRQRDTVTATGEARFDL
jgi:hypothetical protein